MPRAVSRAYRNMRGVRKEFGSRKNSVRNSAPRLGFDLWGGDMTYVLSLDQVNHVLGDVFRMIANALEGLGDE